MEAPRGLKFLLPVWPLPLRKLDGAEQASTSTILLRVPIALMQAHSTCTTMALPETELVLPESGNQLTVEALGRMFIKAILYPTLPIIGASRFVVCPANLDISFLRQV